MEYSEFVAMLEKLGINVSEHKRRELFVSCDRDGQGFIDYSEFELAWRRLQLMIVEATLHKMGLTPQVGCNHHYPMGACLRVDLAHGAVAVTDLIGVSIGRRCRREMRSLQNIAKL
mmetsp:Transcript_52490/g.166939  ORF Transcript_52490/g.166939 Transcript_52490/m.166939 type:complete len:116 (+) Transcript_52490:560-907(+)